MDSPSFPTGRSAPDARAAEPATARPAAPVQVAKGTAALAVPAPGFDIESLITEDDEPVDMLSEKQQRLLTGPLYSFWAGPGDGRPFLAAANVGVFPEPRNPAIVPDVFLSLDVQAHENWWDKKHRSYFVWEFGKAPDLVVEIVLNQKGNEIGEKRMRYARMGVGYYVVFDPLRQMGDELRVFRLSGGRYERQGRLWFPELGLGMTLWEGEFEWVRGRWLRWTDAQGELIPTGKERADQEAAVRRQEAAARQAAEARVAELEALLGRRST